MSEVLVPAASGRRLSLAPVLLVAVAWIALWWNTALEDPFISFRYSQHLVAGEGLTWNPGEAPVEGFSNLLWVLILAVPARLGVDLLLASKLIGGLLFLLLLTLLGREGLRLGLAPKHTALAVAPLVVVPAWAYYAASGLETLLFTLLCCAAVVAHVHESEGESGRPWSALWCLLATLTRPEGAGLWALLFLGRATLLRQAPRQLWRWGAPYLVPLAGYLVWKAVYFGSLVPLPFYAKHTGDPSYQLYSGVLYIARFLRDFAGLSALHIAWMLWFAGRDGRMGRGARQLVLIVALYPIYLLATGGDVEAAFPSFRLLLPLGPVLVLLSMLGAKPLVHRRPLTGMLALQLLLIAGVALPQAHDLHLFTRRANSYNGVPTRPLHLPGEPPAAAFLREDARRRGLERPSLAVLAAGQLPYYTGFHCIDRLGLNDPRVAHGPKRQHGLDTKHDTALLLALTPDYIQTNIPAQEVRCGQVSRQWRRADQELWESADFQRDYALLGDCPDSRAFFARRAEAAPREASPGL